MAKLSALIIAKNEERNLPSCLESVRWADEILLVDTGSTDRTVQIAESHGARLLRRQYVNSAVTKNWAIPQASCEWVFVIDCDERATPELQRELRQLLARGPECEGYRVFRENYFFGHRIRHCGWERDDVLRLFRREAGRYPDRQVHADVEIKSGSVGVLRGKLLHYPYWTFDQYLEKFGRYTSWAAADLRRAGVRTSLARLVVRPLWRFFRMYFLRLGFLDGRVGLVLCGLAAMSVFAKYAKLWAMDHTLWGVNGECVVPPGPEPGDEDLARLELAGTQER